MAPIAAILFLALAFDYGYTSESKISWPKKFHLVGDSMNLLSGTSQPFEIWYNGYVRRSRIDINHGTIKKYYYKMSEKNLVLVRKFHPVSNEIFFYTMICERSTSENTIEEVFFDYLPWIENFDYIGEETHRGEPVEVWMNNFSDTETKNLNEQTEETILLRRNARNYTEGFPIRYTMKTWNMENGALIYHSIINYDTMEKKVSLKDLIVNRRISCPYVTHKLDSILEDLHPNDPGHVDIAFHRYHKHHNKSYENKEYEQRKEIFRENWKLIKEHNNKNFTYKLSMNEFADWTPGELQYLHDTGVKEDVAVEGIMSFPHTEAEIEDMVKDLPENYDLRFEGYISNVKDQGKCKAGWAFAATAAVEGALARSNGGNLVDLSPQSLVDCTWKYYTSGCNGTFNIKSVFNYIYDVGIPTTMDYGPYLEEEGRCRIFSIILLKSKLYNIKSFVSVTPLSENALKLALYKYGPVTVVISVNKKMMLYSSGVYYNKYCDYQAGNHAVTVVGYGVRDGGLYWIVKNSWGESWGQDGYILLAAKDNNCNLMNNPYYAIV